jgi:hypothetical protein
VIETPAYDLTIFKLHFGKLTLKAEKESEQERSKKGVSSRTFLDGPNSDLVACPDPDLIRP